MIAFQPQQFVIVSPEASMLIHDQTEVRRFGVTDDSSGPWRLPQQKRQVNCAVSRVFTIAIFRNSRRLLSGLENGTLSGSSCPAPTKEFL